MRNQYQLTRVSDEWVLRISHMGKMSSSKRNSALSTSVAEFNDGVGGVAGEIAGEEQPSLRSSPPASESLVSRWQKKMMADVSYEWADLVLLLCYLITGLLDSSSISVWGSFVSLQTGNTVYLGLGLTAPSASTRWIKSGTSLGCFCLGGFVFSRFHRYFSPKRRWVMFISFFAQMGLTIAAAVIVTINSKSAKADVTWNVLVPIALVAFQSCGQAVASRALRCNALTSVVLTSIYCDLFSDADLFATKNAERNRRVAAPILFLIGGVVCGLLFSRSEAGIAGTLWTVAVLKLLVAALWVFWPADPNAENK